MKFEWDEKKNEANLKKHAVAFEEAKSVWTDSTAMEFYDQLHSVGEERYLRIGKSSIGRVLLVVFREDERSLEIRIISARRATKREIVKYEKGI